MRFSEINFHPDRRMLRQFAALCFVFIGGIGLYQGLVRERATLGLILGALAVVVGPLGLIWPAAIRPLFVAWTVAAFPIGWLVSHLVLGLIYFGVFTPVSLLFRLIGRDALTRRQPPPGSTFLVPKPMPTDPSSYLRQS